MHASSWRGYRRGSGKCCNRSCGTDCRLPCARTIRNAVNFPSIPADQVARLQPYLNLAEKLGSFAAQVFEGGITGVTIEYMGDASELNTAPVTIAALKGLLTPILEETVNFVNALLLQRSAA